MRPKASAQPSLPDELTAQSLAGVPELAALLRPRRTGGEHGRVRLAGQLDTHAQCGRLGEAAPVLGYGGAPVTGGGPATIDP